MVMSPENVDMRIISAAREQASEKLKTRVGHAEIQGNTVIVRAGRKQVKYRIIHSFSCNEHGEPYLGSDTWELRELEVSAIPFLRKWLAVGRRRDGPQR